MRRIFTLFLVFASTNMTPDDHVVAFVRDGHPRQGGECRGHDDDDDVASFAKRDDVCGVGGVYVSELFAGQSDEGGQDEIGQDVFRALPHVSLLRWRGIVDLRLRDAVRITFSSVLLLYFGDGLGSERFGQGGGKKTCGSFFMEGRPRSWKR